MHPKTYRYLKFIRYKDVIEWDLKRHMTASIRSKFPISQLGNHIQEENRKFDISVADCQYGILGVNNQTGIFDAYIGNGTTFHQKYKKMETGWIAYNPYRVNIGSIGIKRQEHHYEYISPAYVVFSCRPTLLPDYLYLAMKTSAFNKAIRDNTTGSVRQNLTFNSLQRLSIPLPPLDKQQTLVNAYLAKVQQADKLDIQSEQIKTEIRDYLLTELGINTPKPNKATPYEVHESTMEYIATQQQETTDGKTCHWGNEIKKEYHYLKFARYKDVNEWGYDKISGNNKHVLHSTLYPNQSLGLLVEINPLTSFSKLDNDACISFIPMECISDEYGELRERRICNVAASKGYTKFQNGDLLWAKITPCMQNGKSAIAENLENGYGCGSTEFHILRNNDKRLNMHYIHMLLRMPVVLKDAMLSFTGTAGQQRVPKNYLENLSIPVPPIDIQDTIVEHINKQKEQVKQLKAQADTLRKEALKEFENEIFEKNQSN
ncbi:MAG: restriction endonuclease subunit S [Bacteroidaceae bacterium]|nr:restriction endonuclease subunit S [Bacteroidaceae bacterium]